MAATYELELNLKPGGINQRIHLNQYDKGQSIIIHLYNDDQVYTPVGTMWISGTKKDNTGFKYQCSVSGSDVTAIVTDQMTCYYGETIAEVSDIKDGVVQGSANFILDVEKAALDDDVVISKTDIPVTQRVAEDIDKIETWKSDTEAAADKAQKAIESTDANATRAETAQSKAETAQTATEQLKADTSAIKDEASASATLAESYARGDTGTRDGEDTDNASYYRTQAELAKTASELAKTDAQTLKTDVEQLKTDTTSLKDDAAASATLAESYAKGGTGTRDGENTDNAKHYADQAKASAEAAAAGMKTATTEVAGAVKPDGKTLLIQADGTVLVSPEITDLERLTEDKTTVFNADGSIIETLADGSKRTTVFGSDGNITEALYDSTGKLKQTTKTIFDGDTITEEVQ